MMLLIGMKISFTKKPMNPMIAKPIDVADAHHRVVKQQ